MSSIADRLRLLRIMWGEESARSLSLKLGISPGAWNVWERGSSAPSAEILAKLAERGVNINWLLTGEGAPMLSSEGIKTLSSAIEWVGQKQATRLGLGRLALTARRARVLARTQILTRLTSVMPTPLTLSELLSITRLPEEDLLSALMELVDAGLVEVDNSGGTESYRPSSPIAWTSSGQEADAAALNLEAIEFLVDDCASGVPIAPQEIYFLSATIGVSSSKEYLAALKEFIMTKSVQSESASQTIKLIVAAKKLRIS